MSAMSAKSGSTTFFIDGVNLGGATGRLFGRAGGAPANGLVPLERLAAKLKGPVAHYDLLHSIFAEKRVFSFEIHSGLKVAVSATGVISELVKRGDEMAALVEFDVMA